MEDVAKRRQPKASQQQIDHMVDYFVLNPHVASGKSTSINASSRLRGSWEELVAQLNSMFPKEGMGKDVKSWKSTWRDNKSAVATKVAKIKNCRRATGNKKLPENLVLTEREKKIISLVGIHYVEGDPLVPDSFPEEHNGSIFESIQEMDSSSFQAGLEEPLNQEIIYNGTAVELSHEASSNENANEVPPSLTVRAPIERHSQEKQQSSCRRGRADSVGNQLLFEARNEFRDIAERQVACMEMFAEAVSQQNQIWERVASVQEQTNVLLQCLIDKFKPP